MRILIVEDDPTICAELETLLRGSGYQALAVTDPSAALQAAKSWKPQLILLDIRLPQESGFSICSQIRTFSNVPIIFVTACNTDIDELNSILLGGDAFITKPYNPAILLAKIASLLKRTAPLEAAETLQWQDAILHMNSGRLEYHGKQTDLTKTELKLLYHLFRHAGTICTRSELIEALWDHQVYIDDNALSVNIGRIREKLAALGLTNFIQTRHRQGYLI